MNSELLLSIKDLRVTFDSRFGLVRALNGIALEVYKGESLGIVGESGSGKSVTALSILKLLDQNATLSAEEMLFEGEDLLEKSEAEMRRIRGRKISMIFQDPMSSLNPVLTVGHQVEETLSLHSDLKPKPRRHKVIDMFDSVGIPNPDLTQKSYPHQFSGGMNQRIMVAMALSCQPSLMIADEPTTALDVTTQAQILDLLKKLISEEQASLLLITHDLGVIREVCERVCVMYGGKIVEEGLVQDVLFSPLHPYTKGLISCIPRIRSSIEKLQNIPGDVPKGTDLPSGCMFHPRCEKARDICAEEQPSLVSIDNHKVRCFCFDPDKDDLWG
jgi:oligopeptide/dipeptide ABC transporter ATP-binding protein